jgi:hypothetical protein
MWKKLAKALVTLSHSFNIVQSPSTSKIVTKQWAFPLIVVARAETKGRMV